MQRLAVRSLFIVLAMVSLAPRSALARDLSFEDRVKCQEAIERVYYSHQIGATRPFEEAVPRQLLDHKVRTYLKQSLALQDLWKTPVTAEMLSRETERILGSTRTPGRLQELVAALGGDPFLLQECVSRATLVDRLTHNFFAYDQRFHSASRAEAEELRGRLERGETRSLPSHPDRTIVDLVRTNADDIQRERNVKEPIQRGGRDLPVQMNVTPEEFNRWRSRLPERVGEVGPVSEDPYGFSIRRVLSKAPGTLRFASYFVRKRTWDDWWGQVAGDFQEMSVVAVARTVKPSLAHRIDRLAGPSATTSSTLAGSDSADTAPTGCTPENSWDGGLRSAPPVPRYRHVAVWTGSLMIVWGGGDDGNDVGHSDGGRYDPLTDTWTPTSTMNAPGTDPQHGDDKAVWSGRYMIIFGTAGAAKYDPVMDVWSPVSGVNAPGFPEGGHTAIWTGTQIVVWGGAYCSDDYDTCGYTCATGGRYDPETDTWSPITTVNAPTCRAGHTAVWTGTEMVVWGGWAGGGSLSSGGRYNPVTDTWRPMATENAPTGGAAVWTGTEMVVWGGQGGRYNPATDTWTSISTIGAPVGSGFNSVWTGSLMLVWPVYGDGPGGRYDPVSDLWTSISAENAPPGTPSPVWTGSLMLVWGVSNLGLTEGARGGRYDPVADAWTPMTTGPDERERHTAVWTGNQMIVWGGDRWYDRLRYPPGARYDPMTDSWTTISTILEPTRRDGHTAVWTGETMVIWGGRNDHDDCPSYFCNSGGRYNPTTDTWSSVALPNAPIGLIGHAAVWTGESMVIWGGSANDCPAWNCSTGGRYNPATDAWVATTLVNAPEARAGHTAVWTGTQMVVWGGYDTYGLVTSGGRYNPATDTWVATSLVNAPEARAEHTAVWTGTQMVVWGGYDAYGLSNTGGRYDPVTDSWMPTSTLDAPLARWGHAAVWTGQTMVLWGGAADDCPSYYCSTGGRYNPATDTWSPTAIVNAPQGRYGYTAVWTGSQMLIWGGFGSNTGGRYTPDPPVDGDGDGYTACDGDCNDSDPSAHPGAVETCNGVDDDCNGMVDDGVERSSECGIGACHRTGIETCTAGVWGGNTCTPGQATAETCNGADDDCDGLVDEGLAIGRLSVVPTPFILWPPNHRLVDVHVTVANIGGCSTSGGSISYVLNSVVSDEPDNAAGPDDGDTVNDIREALPGSADLDLQLRAERDGDGVGRMYEVAYTAVDSSGNSANGTTFVFVPHDQGGITEPVVVSAENGPTGTSLRWDPVVGALSYRVIRGNVGSLREAEDFIDLGTISCIATDSSAVSTVGHEDPEMPPLGQVFFYAVAYDDGRDSGYGTDTVSKPRIQSGGGCFPFQARRPSLSPLSPSPGSIQRPPRRRLP